MKIAVVHDWLVTIGGAEKVLSAILDCFPDADLFSIIDFLPYDKRQHIRYKTVKTSFIQKFPLSKKNYRFYLPLMPLAIEQFDLSAYDLVISSSHAVSKGVLTGPNQLHICYCHTPIRYAWDLQSQYLHETKLEHGIKSWFIRWFLHKIRIWDLRCVNGVDYYISNSNFIAKRIKKYYAVDAITIYPNVETDSFTPEHIKEDFYFTASRLVPYKKIDLIINAFNQMPNKKLIVVGEGPDFEKIKKISTNNVKFLGYQSDLELKYLMQTSKAFIFAAEEDFGIISVEAQACGTPVIAYAKGGSLETVLGLEHDNPTGVFFPEQTKQSIIDAVTIFEQNVNRITKENCVKHAAKFSTTCFKDKFTNFIVEKTIQFSPKLAIQEQIGFNQTQNLLISVFIPTLNATANSPSFSKLLSILKQANLHRVLVIDSSSNDDTVSVVKSFGFEVKIIPKTEFDHGGTRQLATEILHDSEYIIFLTQDVIFNSTVSINNLLDFMIKNKLAAAYGRQLPHKDADLFAIHLRLFNYAKQSYIRVYEDRIKYGIRSTFSSNSFAAYNRKKLLSVGGFPKNNIFAEDMFIFGKLLKEQNLVGYCAEAVCFHSHNYTLLQNFKRYFDIGVFQKQNSWITKDFGYPTGAGKKFAVSETIHILKHNPLLIPLSLLHTICKFIGYNLGYNYTKFNIKWRKYFSMHKGFWKEEDCK